MWEDAVEHAVRAATTALAAKLEAAAVSTSSGARTVFSGSLDDMGVADLVQTVNVNRKSGVLTIRAGHRSGRIWMLDGRVHDAEIGRAKGARAVYRMLGMTHGSFTVEIGPVDRPATIAEDPMGLLMEGLRRSDEMAHQLEGIASLGQVLAVDEAMANGDQVLLMPAAKRIIEAFRRGKTVDQVLDDVDDIGDLEVVQHVASMLKTGVLKPTNNPPTEDLSWTYEPSVARMLEDSPSAAESVEEPVVVPRRGGRAVVLGGLAGMVAAGAVAYGYLHLDRQRELPTDTAGPAVPVVAAAVEQPPPPPSPCGDDMVHVTGGTFFAGSQSEHPALSMATPSHKVTLDSYCIAKHEVTVDEYRACSEAGHCERAHRTSFWPRGSTEKRDWENQRAVLSQFCNEAYEDRGKHPINCVTWKQADAFCRSRGQRLPTEAEWEYAVRGRDGRVYPWGDEPPGPTNNNGCGRECVSWRVDAGLSEHPVMYEANDGFVGTAPVGSFPEGVTESGMFDVVGNVFEWTADRFYTYDEKPRINPRGPEEGNERIIRGGAFNSFVPEFAEPALRFPLEETAHSHGVGFRCAADPRDSKVEQ